MRILLYNLNYVPKPTRNGLYSGGLARSLAELGHEVKVVCAVPRAYMPALAGARR